MSKPNDAFDVEIRIFKLVAKIMAECGYEDIDAVKRKHIDDVFDCASDVTRLILTNNSK